MMKLPIRIFSDLHLGHKASRISRAESLRPLLCGAGTVVFNGDSWEELAEPWKENSASMLADLKGILAEEGCDAVFLRGNHDPGWHGPGYMTLADERIVITHGDALLPASSPWKREIITGARTIDEIWARYPDAGTNLESRLRIACDIATRLRSHEYPNSRHSLSRALDAAFPPERALSMLSAWIGQGKSGATFCESYFPNAEFLVIGHFHCAAVRKARGKTVVNTGSFVIPGPARWVSWDGKSLSYGEVRERIGECSLGRETHKWNLF